MKITIKNMNCNILLKYWINRNRYVQEISIKVSKSLVDTAGKNDYKFLYNFFSTRLLTLFYYYHHLLPID